MLSIIMHTTEISEYALARLAINLKSIGGSSRHFRILKIFGLERDDVVDYLTAVSSVGRKYNEAINRPVVLTAFSANFDESLT